MVDLTGERFSHLVVVLDDKDKKVLCRCDCGKEKRVARGHLKSGATKSCGCLHYQRSKQLKDLSGQEIGDFLILARDKNSVLPSGQQKTTWLAQCIHCSHVKKWAATNILSGKGSRCGCQLREKAEQNEASFWKMYIKSYKDGAYTRKLEWNLTDDEFKALTLQNCSYCGEAPKRRKAHHRALCVVSVNGIDRLNPSLGYSSQNCVPCCSVCNRMKMSMTKDEFINQVRRINQHHQ